MTELDNISIEEQALYESLMPDDDSNNPKHYNLDEDIQRHILGMVMTDRYFMVQSLGLIKSKYFVNIAHQCLYETVTNYFERYKSMPHKFYIKQNLGDKAQNEDQKVYFLAELDAIVEYYVPGIEHREFLLDEITHFAKTEAMRIAFSKCIKMLNNDNGERQMWGNISDVLRDAQMVERNFDIGLDYFSTVDERYDHMQEEAENKEFFTTGFPDIDEALGGGLGRGEVGAWIALPGAGKCFRRDTKILMFDGTLKNVQDVNPGDLVMGNDSTPRKVLSCHCGVSQMYKVQPNKGDAYYVNEEHILSLKNSHATPYLDRKGVRHKNLPFHNHFSKSEEDSQTFNISVKDYLNQSKHFKDKMKGYRTGVDFPEKPVLVDPYFLGIWLGDGMSNTTGITNVDQEVIDEVYKVACKRGLQVRPREDDYFVYSEENKIKPPGKGASNNNLAEDLKHYGLFVSCRKGSKKHVPHDYKVNSKEVRLEILAGLLDSDGSLSNSGFDFTNKNKMLAEDVVFLARSLGLAAYMAPSWKKSQTMTSKRKYWRVSISGDCSIIPVKIERKKALPRKSIRNVLHTGITVTKAGKGEYYGFETDGNHLFLLGDFTVVHNSLALVKGSVANLVQGKKVLFVSLEMDQPKIAQRFDAQIAVQDISKLHLKRDVIVEALSEFSSQYEDRRRLIVKQFPSGQADANTIRAFLQQLELYGFKPDLVVVDYIGEMKDLANMPVHESREKLIQQLRALGTENGHSTFTALQPNRSAKDAQEGKKYIDDGQLGDSYNQFRPLDAFWSINQTQCEKDQGLGRVFVIKHRNGKSKFGFPIGYDYGPGKCRADGVCSLNMFQVDEKFYTGRLNEAIEAAKMSTKIDSIPSAKMNLGNASPEAIQQVIGNH